MNIIAIIPARGGSKRIHRKNILPLAGKPLLQYSIEHAKRSSHIKRIIVSTDDYEISCVASACGAEVVERPPELSDDFVSSESALLHALGHLEQKEGFDPDLIVFLQCTSPLRQHDDIDGAIDTLIRGRYDSLFSAFKFNKYIWQMNGDSVVSINYDYMKRLREQDFPEQFQENGSIYVMKPYVLKQFNNRLGGKIGVYEMSCLDSIQIDTYEDIELCECILSIKKNCRSES